MPDEDNQGEGEVEDASPVDEVSDFVDMDLTESEYASFDPSVIGPRQVGPPPEGGQESPGEVDGEKLLLPQFDPRCHDEFDGLLFVGALQKTFKYVGHSFKIRTINTDQSLEMALIIKPWDGTVAAPKAYQTAVVAASLVSIDGRPLPVPVTNDPHDTLLSNHFDWVRKSLFPPVVDAIYQHSLLLEQVVDRVIAAMGEA